MQALVDVQDCYNLNNPVSMGTTIIAVCFDNGIVVGTDSRTSSGKYVVNRVTDKITDIDKRIVCLRSGSAADTQFLANQVKYRMDLNRYHEKAPEHVKLAANIFKNFIYEYKNDLTAGIIVAGYDECNGPQIYSISLGGMITQSQYAIGGSGSIFLYSFFDQNFKENMSQDDCIMLVLRALSLAVWRDGSSGGVARLAIITPNGIERRCVPNNELPTYL